MRPFVIANLLFLLGSAVAGCKAAETESDQPSFRVTGENKKVMSRRAKCEAKKYVWLGETCTDPSANAETPGSTVEAPPKAQSCTDGKVWDPSLQVCRVLGAPHLDKRCQEKDKVWNGSICVSPATPKNFFRYCEDKKNLSPPLELTVRVLLDASGQQGCDSAAQWLGAQTALDLRGQSLMDLRPLTGLRQLRELMVAENKIASLDPVGTIKGLRLLDLFGNKVKGVAPLRFLHQLEQLYLGDNPLRDVSPLQELSRLRELDLAGTPLATGEEARHEDNCPTTAGPPLLIEFCSR